MTKNIKVCFVCRKLCRWNLFWEIQKWYLRITEISYLWENCCSSKCYQRLLAQILLGKVQISNENKSTKAIGWVICHCGQKHRLIPAIDTPVYWCGNELLKLKEGDDVDIEEVNE